MSKIDELKKLTKDNPINIISGPTAVGKGTISHKLADENKNIFLSISSTTRNMRRGEKAGYDYNYLTEEQFKKDLDAGEFLEYAKVHNSFYYATPITPLIENLKKGKKVILEIDIQGARSVRKILPYSKLIFLDPPTFDDLIARQAVRDTEDFKERQIRLHTAKIEMQVAKEFDYIIVNDKVSTTVDKVYDII
jgi:guanylate kinase